MISDPLDPESTFISATPEQGACTVDASVVTCQIGTLAPGATDVETVVVVQVAAGATAVLRTRRP